MRANYDCIIVGKGLIGSAAAKYIQSTLNHVAIVGPDEPTDDKDSLVYASHYDQGRVQQMIGMDPVWTTLNKQSIQKYPSLQSESGITFHYPVGCLYISPYGKDEHLTTLPEQAHSFNVGYQYFNDAESLAKTIPDFRFPAGSFAMLEPNPTGHINPMNLIKAQLEVFKKKGGVIYKETVLGIENKDQEYIIHTQQGIKLSSPKVLVAAGAFINFMKLIPKSLDLLLKSETVLLAQVDKQEALRLSHLPSFLYKLDDGIAEGVYGIRPIEYPDGNYYLKIGCNLTSDIIFSSLQEIQEWFRDGDSESNKQKLKEILHSILPNIKVRDYKTKRCIISRTKHKKPYIGSTGENNLFVAAGGNGHSAMCSDALGKIAAGYVLNGNIPDDFAAHTFDPVFI